MYRHISVPSAPGVAPTTDIISTQLCSFNMKKVINVNISIPASGKINIKVFGDKGYKNIISLTNENENQSLKFDFILNDYQQNYFIEALDYNNDKVIDTLFHFKDQNQDFPKFSVKKKIIQDTLEEDDTSTAKSVDKEEDDTSTAKSVDKEEDDTSTTKSVDKEEDDTSTAKSVDKEDYESVSSNIGDAEEVIDSDNDTRSITKIDNLDEELVENNTQQYNLDRFLKPKEEINFMTASGKPIIINHDSIQNLINKQS